MKWILWPWLLFWSFYSWAACNDCITACEEQRFICSKICKDSCFDCQQKTAMNSAQAYAGFVHEQTVQGGIVSRERLSYRDPLHCLKKTCDCVADFSLCKESCSGSIKKFVMPLPRCC
jgi:hypothetical protein